MSIPYRHKRTLRRVGMAALVTVSILLVTWLCWVVWLQRYVVYTSNGARLDFHVSSYEVVGQIAKPKEAEHNISIYYNEGADAIDTSKDMTQIVGYYITSDMFQKNMADIQLQIERLPAGTPVMIDMKGPYGSFFYQSQLPGAVASASTDIPGVVDLLTKMKMKGFRIYLQGDNLFLLTKYPGWDPEVSSNMDPRFFGVDNLSVPQTRTYTFGVNLTF